MHPFTDARLEQALQETAARLGVTISAHEVVLRGHEVPATQLRPHRWGRDAQVLVVGARG